RHPLLELIGRIQPGATRASLEAEMRVELKCARTGRDERQRSREISRADPVPGPRRRRHYQHARAIRDLASNFDDGFRICAADRLLQRGQSYDRARHGAAADIVEHGARAQASRLVRQALTESILLSLLGGAAGVMIAFAGTHFVLHFAFPPVNGMAGIPIDASPSMPVRLFAFGVSLITGIAFGAAPAWMATRVEPMEARRGDSRSTARTGSLP